MRRLYGEIDDMPLEVTGPAAKLINDYCRLTGGFIDSEGLKNVLRIVAMFSYEYERHRSAKIQPVIIPEDE